MSEAHEILVMKQEVEDEPAGDSCAAVDGSVHDCIANNCVSVDLITDASMPIGSKVAAEDDAKRHDLVSPFFRDSNKGFRRPPVLFLHYKSP